MDTFREKQNELDVTLENEVRGKSSKELQTLLANSNVRHSIKEAIRAELDIRLSKGISDLDITMSGVGSSVDTLVKSIDKLDKSTTKYNRWLIGLSVIITILTLVYPGATIVMLAKMFIK